MPARALSRAAPTVDSTAEDTARAIALVVREGFDRHYALFRECARAARSYFEAGDWLVWQLTSGPFPNCNPGALARSTCQAGYKAMWNKQTGYPSRDYFNAVDPRLADVVTAKMPGTLMAPGQRAGVLTAAAASPRITTARATLSQREIRMVTMRGGLA